MKRGREDANVDDDRMQNLRSTLESLPHNLLEFFIINYLDPRDILVLCSTNKNLNQLCRNKEFLLRWFQTILPAQAAVANVYQLRKFSTSEEIKNTILEAYEKQQIIDQIRQIFNQSNQVNVRRWVTIAVESGVNPIMLEIASTRVLKTFLRRLQQQIGGRKCPRCGEQHHPSDTSRGLFF